MTAARAVTLGLRLVRDRRHPSLWRVRRKWVDVSPPLDIWRALSALELCGAALERAP